MTITADTPSSATPGIQTPRACCPHWWARRGHIHECVERLLHGTKHRCDCGEEQGR